MSAERCSICGFDGSSVSVADAIAALRSFPRRYRGAFAVAGDDEELLIRRPSPEVWSALEYAGHARDTITANGRCMAHALTDPNPEIEWPADVDHHPAPNVGDAATVLQELADACEQVASKAERTDAGEWKRTIRRHGGVGDVVDALWFLRHCVHEGSHHLRDVQRVLQQVVGGR